MGKNKVFLLRTPIFDHFSHKESLNMQQCPTMPLYVQTVSGQIVLISGVHVNGDRIRTV